MTPKRDQPAAKLDASSSDRPVQPVRPAGPSSAPELDPALLKKQEQEEIQAAFATEEDADVIAELPDKDSSDDDGDARTADDGQASADGVDGNTESAGQQPAEPRRPNWLVRFFRGYGRRWKWTVPLTLVVLLGAVLAVPASRYPTLALFLKNDMVITVTDDRTKQPVGSVVVELDGQKAMTDTKGQAMVKAKVGWRMVKVGKRYYRDASSRVFVPVTDQKNKLAITITATGRQVPLSVTNQLTGQPIENALIKAAGTEIKTGKDGTAVLVLPADKAVQTAEISADKFDGLKATIAVTEAVDPQNKFQLTPSGKVYFLSKKSGRIDVVKTSLNGGDRQVVVAGTGREEDGNTILLASRDWKYLALLSRRDSARPKLYLIDTSNDKMSVIDEGDAEFRPIGWSDYTFVYSVYRDKLQDWQPGKTAVKSFSAGNNKLATLDQSQAEGDQNNYKYQTLGSFYLVGSKVVYVTDWSVVNFYYDPNVESGKLDTIRSINANGTDRKDLRNFNSDKFYAYEARPYKPGEIYFAAYSAEAKKYTFYEYEDNALKPAGIEENDFRKVYPSYLESPSGKRVFWSDQRDGKGTFFVGNGKAEEPKEIATLDDHQVYGWYGEDYVLVSKRGSELYIMSSGGGKLTKVADYHKPSVTFRGYGGGYGGL